MIKFLDKIKLWMVDKDLYKLNIYDLSYDYWSDNSFGNTLDIYCIKHQIHINFKMKIIAVLENPNKNYVLWDKSADISASNIQKIINYYYKFNQLSAFL